MEIFDLAAVVYFI